MGGFPELLGGVFGRSAAGGIVVSEANVAPTELEHRSLEATDYLAIDEALLDGWVINCRGKQSDIRTAWMNPQGSHSDTYEGYGLTLGDAIRSAVVRKQNNRGGLFRPTDQLRQRYSGVAVPRSSLDANGSSTIVIRRASSEDPVVIKVGGEFYSGSSFHAAVATFDSKHSLP